MGQNIRRKEPPISAARYLSRVSPFYYGWIVAAVAGAANFSRVSAAVEVSSIFLPALVAEYGWSLGLIASATTIGSTVSAVAGPFVGQLLDRYGARIVIPLGAFIVGLGCLSLAGVRTAVLFVVGYAVVRAAGQSMVLFPSSVVVAQWFERRRGTATAMMSAISAAGLIVGPVGAQAIISSAGVGPAWAALGVMALVLGVVPGLLLFTRRPEDLGLRPDGAAEPRGSAPDKAATAQRSGGGDYSLSLALRTPALWGIIAVSFFISGVMTGVSFHQLNYYTLRGIDPNVGAAIVGVYSLGITVGGVGWGWLADRVSARVLLLVICTFSAALIVLLLLGVDRAWQAFPIGFAFGTLVGGAMSIPTLLVADYYGRSSLGAIAGIVYTARSLGLGFGPLVAGVLYDVTSSYQTAFAGFIVVSLGSAAVMGVMRRPTRPMEQARAAAL